MPNIECKRVERKCDWNDGVNEGRNQGHKFYDFDVYIDGDRRAQFRPGIYKGYDLYDGDGFRIKNPNRGPWSRHSDVPAQAKFDEAILDWLGRGLIPTLEQLAEARAKRQSDHEAAEAARKEQERIECIQRAAVDLYEALKDLAEIDAEELLDSTSETWQRAFAAIAKADGAALTSTE